MASEYLSTAVFSTALVTAAGWLGTRLYDFFAKKFEKRERRRISIVRFYADIRLRAESLVGFADTDYVASVETMIREHASADKPFRFFGVQISDTVSHEQINEYLHTISSEHAYLIRKAILRDRLCVAEYDKLQSMEFSELEADRQIEAFRSFIRNATELRETTEDVQALIESWPELNAASKSSNRSNNRSHVASP